jgi:hypothetical protein
MIIALILFFLLVMIILRNLLCGLKDKIAYWENRIRMLESKTSSRDYALDEFLGVKYSEKGRFEKKVKT